MPHSKADDVLLKNLVPLNTLSEEQLGHLLSQIVVEKAKKGDYLFREGDTDHQNVYLLSGTVALLSGQKEMDLISSGTPTARFALAHQLPRKHSAQARTTVTYVRIDSRMLSDMLARSHSASYEVKDIEQPSSGDWMSLLLQSPVFQQIPPANLQRVMMRMEEVQVSAGDVIINQGEEGDYFYLISKGECSVSRTPEAGHAPVELALLQAGRGFGEEALISDKPRSSSVVMTTDGVLVRLNKQDFIELVNQPLSRALSYDDAIEMIEKGALWLDVRAPEAYEEGHLPGAINLPFFSLRFQASSLTLDRAYVVYGEEVGQSATAAYLLTERGAEVFVMDVNWAQIAELIGINEQSDEAQVNNVIDFNRESDDASPSAVDSPEEKRKLNRLKKELDEARRQFEQELEQRHTEIKLLRQALAVAKSRMQAGEEGAQNAHALQQEVQQLQESLQKAESRLSEGEDLADEKRALQERVDDLEQSLDATRDELNGARQLNDEARQQGNDLREQLNQLQVRHEEDEGRLKEEITTLQIQLESANEALHDEQEKQTAVESEYQQQVETAQQSLSQTQDELKQLRAANQQAATEHRQQLEEIIQTSKQAATKAGEKIADLQQRIEAADSAQSALQAERDELTERLQTEQSRVISLQQSLEAMEERRGGLEKELDAVRQAGNDADAQYSNAMESLRSELERAREGVDQLRQEKHQNEQLLASRDSELSKAEARLTELQAELAKQTETNGEQVSGLQQALASLEEVSHQAQEREQQLTQALEASRLDGDEELATLREQLQEAQATARQQSEKRVEFEARLEQEHQTAAFLKRSLETAEQAVEISNKDLNDVQEAQQALEAQLRERQEALQALEQQNAESQQQLSDQQTEWQDRLQALERELSDKQQLSEQFAQQLEAANESLGDVRQTQADLEAGHQALTSEKADLENRLEQAQAELAERLQAHEAELAAQKAAFAELQQELATEKESAQRVGELQTSLESMGQELEQVHETAQSQVAERQQREKELEETIEQQRRQVEALQTAASDAEQHAVDQQALQSSREALRKAEEEIEALKREVGGLREVQMEMESQLTDDVDTEMHTLRTALETETKKREKSEKLARQADVLRRERQVQETAIEMLGEDLETLVKEKDTLVAERDNLAGQLSELRSQYTDLINENDHLHSEMSGIREQVTDSSMADDLLVQMEELRIKAENFESERDEAKAEATRMRREVGELRSVIETYVEQIQDVQSFGVDEQVAALRTELDMVRRQAAADLEHMRSELSTAKSRLEATSGRDVDEVAALQASRQEMVSLQQSLSEKDHMLRMSQGQCRSLEDAIEDRDKEVDQLKRKLELLLRKAGGLDHPSMQLGSDSPDGEFRSDAQVQPSNADAQSGDADPKRSSLGRLFRRK
ncbi:MAG: cyclic nucleotide-binding domain-containing protein [Candidatus Thiodiazotropha sp. (ex Dulcina madagascariensis)]|nr:cyclic nucleotide-binding domain-containing protein [Candidatus Thiodiazotropha sp. (ex Dulcina madagascariensis)]MCU7924923.1 cyclic nucleotide-binding domain-containing protein [Candidatus Thiodiazotropha sp. (ex Dulcina madagascariensis)]